MKAIDRNENFGCSQDSLDKPENPIEFVKAANRYGSVKVYQDIILATKSYQDKQHFRLATQHRIRQYHLQDSQSSMQFLKELKQQENQLTKILKQLVPETQIGQKLATIKGMGPRYTSQLILYLHPIEKWHGLRSLWKYAGWAPKTERGHNYNHKLHALTVSITKRQIKENSHYGVIYQKYLEELAPKIVDNEVKLKKTAFQRAAKQFLKDLYFNWLQETAK